MNRTLIMLTAISTLALAVPVWAQDSTVQTQDKVQTNADGSSSEKGTTTKEGTDASGTYTSDQTKVKSNIDANGNGEKSVETKSVNDPKGLFNKTTTDTTDTTKVKNGKVHKKHKKTVNGSTVEKSDTTTGTTTGQ